MSESSRTMVKVTYEDTMYKVPEGVKKDIDDLFTKWESGSMPVSEMAPRDSIIMAKKARELKGELDLIKAKIDDLPRKIKEKYFS